MPLQPSTIFPVLDSAHFCSKTYIRIGNHLHVKSSGVAQGLAKFANPHPRDWEGERWVQLELTEEVATKELNQRWRRRQREQLESSRFRLRRQISRNYQCFVEKSGLENYRHDHTKWINLLDILLYYFCSK